MKVFNIYRNNGAVCSWFVLHNRVNFLSQDGDMYVCGFPPAASPITIEGFIITADKRKVSLCLLSPPRHPQDLLKEQLIEWNQIEANKPLRAKWHAMTDISELI